MEILKGIDFTVEVKGLEKYAMCVLHFINIKSSRNAVVDVRTVEGTDIIRVVGLKQFENDLLGTAEDYGKVISSEETNIIMLEIEDAEDIAGKAMKRFMDANEEYFIVGNFE